jgi:hypothetical protein
MFQDAAQYLISLGLLFTTISILLSIYVYKRQMNAQLFLEFTKRYEEIMRTYPDEARALRLESEGTVPPPSEELTVSVLRYLNLCSEEFYLWKNGYLSKQIWRIWENEMKRTVSSPLYTREWETLKKEFDSYSEFADYIRRIQAG